MTSPAPIFLAIDAGTGSTRALAFDGAGALVAHASQEWTHHPVPGHPGGMDFDTKAGWQAIATTIGRVVARLGGRPIAAVAASSMREGFVLHDTHGSELWACPNPDGRARVEADELVSEGLAEQIYRTGGDWVSRVTPAPESTSYGAARLAASGVGAPIPEMSAPDRVLVADSQQQETYRCVAERWHRVYRDVMSIPRATSRRFSLRQEPRVPLTSYAQLRPVPELPPSARHEGDTNGRP